MAEYIFEGDAIIDGVRCKVSGMHTEAVSVEQARNHIVWRIREEYDLTKKLWVDVYIEGILCTTREYTQAKINETKHIMNKVAGKNFEILPKGAEQLEFPINELIKK